MDPTRSREMPSWLTIYLAQIRRSCKISSWIWSIISWVVTVLSRPGRGQSQVEILPRLNWDTQVLPVAYDGACSPNVSVRCLSDDEVSEYDYFGTDLSANYMCCYYYSWHQSWHKMLVQTVYDGSTQVLWQYVCFGVYECEVNLQAHSTSIMVSLTCLQ